MERAVERQVGTGLTEEEALETDHRERKDLSGW